MKRFLWFNFEKMKSDLDYFLMSNLFLIIAQLSFYFPIRSKDFKDTISGLILTGIHVYVLLLKKEFTYKDLVKCFFKN